MEEFLYSKLKRVSRIVIFFYSFLILILYRDLNITLPSSNYLSSLTKSKLKSKFLHPFQLQYPLIKSIKNKFSFSKMNNCFVQ